MEQSIRFTLLSFAVVLAFAGCGDDDRHGSPDAATRPDAAARRDAGTGPDAAMRTDAEPGTDAGTGTDAGMVTGRVGEIALVLTAETDPNAVDSIVRDVACGEGWPLFDGSEWLFATRWDSPPGSISVVGDFDAWDPARHPATTAADGVHHFVRLPAADLPAPVGQKYKWHAAGEFRAPPEATAYGHDEFGEHGWVRPPEGAPHLERCPDFRSAHLGPPRTIRAWIPAGFVPGSPAAASARTLVLHDGQNVFGPDGPFGGWRVDEALGVRAATDIVAIAIDNAPDRFEAYTHVSDVVEAGGPRVGGLADEYVAMLRDEVLPWARARWGIPATGETTMVMGSSLGGLVSLHIARAHPDLARCVAGLSSTLGWGAFDPAASGADALVARWTAHGSVSIYLDSGGGSAGCSDPDGDGVQEDAGDSDNYCVTAQLRDHLDALGYDFGTDLAHWHEPGAGHNEAAWRARVPRALDACEAMGW